MPEQIDEQAILSQAIQDLEPQVPIRSWRLEDNHILLHLADGHTITYNWKTAEPVPEPQAPDLDSLLKTELVEIARDMNLSGYSSMTKAELIAAIKGNPQ